MTRIVRPTLPCCVTATVNGATWFARRKSSPVTSLQSGTGAPVRPGNCIATARTSRMGSVVHCVELKPGKGAQLARSAGRREYS